MTTKYYALFAECECCGHQPDALLVGVTSGLVKGYKWTWSSAVFSDKSKYDLFLNDGWILRGVVRFEDEYGKEVTAKYILDLIRKASRVVCVDFVPC